MLTFYQQSCPHRACVPVRETEGAGVTGGLWEHRRPQRALAVRVSQKTPFLVEDQKRTKPSCEERVRSQKAGRKLSGGQGVGPACAEAWEPKEFITLGGG